MKRTLLGLLLLLGACGPPAHPHWQVARDPTWYPNRFPGREVEVTAFSDQLLGAIAKEEGIKVGVYPVSWSFLQGELLEDRVEGVLSNLPPIAEHLERYDFSDVYLYTGAVLVVREGSSISGIEDLNSKEVGITMGSSDILILASLPDALVTNYTTLPEALLGLWQGEVEAVLAPALVAYTYCADFYEGRLKVVTAPLTDDGLRLIVRKGKAQKLLNDFNQGLHKVVESGAYNRLQEKWGLELEVGPPSPIMRSTKSG